MRDSDRDLVLGASMLVLAALACNLPAASAPIAPVSPSLSAADTEGPPPSQGLEASSTPSATPLPEPSAMPENPLVRQVALCWTGPGKAFQVVSSVKAGTPVELIGIRSIAGWYILRNPIYHDPCWIESKYLTIAPGYDVSHLKSYNPPPRPGPSETPVPTPTS